ncbi:MAG: hypothetical protein ABI237_10800 [Ginsengibacter sp.]
MKKKIFFIIACVFSLIIAIQSIIQLTHVTFIVPGEGFTYNSGHVAGIAVRVLGSIVIAFYFLKRFLDGRSAIS